MTLIVPDISWLKKTAEKFEKQPGLPNVKMAIKHLENHSWFSETVGYLKNGSAQTLVLPMNLLPAYLPDEIVITALMPRENVEEILWIRKEAFNSAQFLKLNENAPVAVFSEMQKNQLHRFRPDLIADVFDPLFFDVNMSDKYSAFIASLDFFEIHFEKNLFEKILLHPREFMPAPGQGVTACITMKDDFYTRRLLKQIHHTATAMCTNVERRFFQLSRQSGFPKPAVYCERGAEGYFHAWAALENKPDSIAIRQLSAPVSQGLAENLFELFMD